MRNLVLLLVVGVALVGCGQETEKLVRVDPVGLEQVREWVPAGFEQEEASREGNGYWAVREVTDWRKAPFRLDEGESWPEMSRERLGEIVEEKRDILEGVERCLEMDYWRVGPIDSFRTLFPELQGLRAVSKLWVRRAELRWEGGEIDGAIEDYSRAGLVADRLEDGGGTVIHLLVSNSIRAIMLQSAVDRKGDEVGRLMAMLGRSEYDVEAMSRFYVDEFHNSFLYAMAVVGLPDQSGGTFVEGGVTYGVELTEESFMGMPRLNAVLVGHESPLDVKKSIELGVQLYEKQIEFVEDKNLQRWDIYEKWANELLYGWILDEDDRVLVPEDDTEFEKMRAELKGIDNVLGRYYVGYLGIQGQVILAIFRGRCQSEGTRGVLAGRGFKNEFDRWPSGWGELVEVGMLGEAPKDWANGEVLGVDFEKGVFWSVGENLVDDGVRERVMGREALDWVWEFEVSH